MNLDRKSVLLEFTKNQPILSFTLPKRLHHTCEYKDIKITNEYVLKAMPDINIEDGVIDIYCDMININIMIPDKLNINKCIVYDYQINRSTLEFRLNDILDAINEVTDVNKLKFYATCIDPITHCEMQLCYTMGNIFDMILNMVYPANKEEE